MQTIPTCPHAKLCGGCQYQGMPYAEQLRLKQERAEALFSVFAPVSPILGADKPCHYRNKVHAAFGYDRQRRVVSGVYQPGSHAIVPVDDCLIEDETADRIVAAIRALLPKLKISVYDERRGGGWLRHVLVRRGFSSGEIMVVPVAVSPVFKNQKAFLSELLDRFPEIRSVVLNINDRFGPVVLGPKNKVLYGDGYIEDTLCSLRFRISPSAFYQINSAQCEKLYAKAIEFAGLTGTETVLDAYCGVGTIGLCAAAKAKQVVGVELNREAVRNAIANARLNGIQNAWFAAGDAGAYLEGMLREGRRPDVLLMDPPRSGSDRRFLDALIRCAPPRVVYISCGPETLRRDLEILTRGGYRAEAIQPVDMFPFTEHVECVVSMSRAGSRQ
ncbi:MAG: 23S rRNA (uracil(1939)-C(5))-methyltransferase RlmD [Clostridia bacterium]